MKKRTILAIVSGGLILIGIIGSGSHSSTPGAVSNTQASIENVTEKAKPRCDGSTVTTNCTLDGATYKTYIYHPAVAEKTHTETVTTYHEEVTGYCTLCNDNTYSPSCATGRGACSWHGGVAQWNAPISRKVPVESTKTVVDSPAIEAYVEKTAE